MFRSCEKGLMANNDRCKVCLVPHSSLMTYGCNLVSHERDCVKSKIPNRVCSKGINCQATLPNHYKTFSHDALAKHLSNSALHSGNGKVVCAKRTSIFDCKSQEEDVKNDPKKIKFGSSKTFPNLECYTQSRSFHSDQQNSPKSELSFPLSSCVDTNLPGCSTSNQDGEFEKLLGDVDVNSWSINDFMDEDTLPLENNDSDQNIFKYSFEHCFDKPKESYFENKQTNGKLTDEDGIQVIDSSDDNMYEIVQKVDKVESWKCNVHPVEKRIVKKFSPKKQVAITSYFGGRSTLKFVEEKSNARSPKAKFPSQRVEHPIQSDEITLAAANERKNRQWSCPFYKKIPGTSFAVDAFCYGNVPGIKYYFLSHFHYDHYRGLNKKFQGSIYCNSITGKLISLKLGIPFASLNILPMEKSTVIDNIEVKLLDANHCPGSIMFLFRFCTGAIILHTGDFRAHHKMECYPELLNCKIDQLYLDTTYLDPMYTFPLQEDVLKFVAALAQQNFARNPKMLFICGSYTIGKEKVFISVAEKLNTKIWASKEKLRILDCIENPSLKARLTQNANFAKIHVLSMNQLNFKGLQEHLNKFHGIFNSILAIKPTGWEYRAGSNISTLSNIRPKTSGAVAIYGLPYSEHSSFDELKKFVKFLSPKKIIPTVSVGNPKRKEMELILNNWKR